MSYLTFPNLPSKRVERMFVSRDLPRNITEKLRYYGVFPVRVPENKAFKSELRFHPDISLMDLGNGKWLAASEICSFVQAYVESVNPVYGIAEAHPYDCILNNLVTKFGIIVGKKTLILLPDALSGYSVLTVNQAYVKCSTVAVTDNAFITSDTGIARLLIDSGCDVLTVTTKGIGLRGFDCGFIGGCAGKIDSDLLAFTGDIALHSDGARIKDFLHNYGVTAISLSDEPLYDYGGLLPITEA